MPVVPAEVESTDWSGAATIRFERAACEQLSRDATEFIDQQSHR
jgi:hypothetical protein